MKREQLLAGVADFIRENEELIDLNQRAGLQARLKRRGTILQEVLQVLMESRWRPAVDQEPLPGEEVLITSADGELQQGFFRRTKDGIWQHWRGDWTRVVMPDDFYWAPVPRLWEEAA